MNLHPLTSQKLSPSRRACRLALGLLIVWMGLCSIPAARAVPTTTSAIPAYEVEALAGARGFAPPPAESLWHQIYGPIESAMGSQQHMIQFATIGMIVALFIIWWRK